MSKVNKQTLRQLLQANLLASVIHDLNNPLGSISLIIELQQEYLDMGKVDSDAFNHQYEQIIKSIETGSKIARDFQNFSGEGDEDKDFFNAADNLNQLNSFSSSYFRKASAELNMDIQDSMIYANQADFNLFIFFIFFSLSSFDYEESKIHVKLENSSIRIDKPSSEFKINDIFSNTLAIEESDSQVIIEKIIEENALEIQDEEKTFLITFKTSET